MELGWLVGMLEIEGCSEGTELGWELGWPDGAAEVDGFSEGCEDGMLDGYAIQRIEQ